MTPVVDYALTRPEIDGDKLGLIGMSLGGYLAARAVAFEHRIRAAVFFGGVYDLFGAIHHMFPKEAVDAFDAGDKVKCEAIITNAMKYVTSLRWAVEQGIWCFGAKDITDYLTKAKLMTMEGVVEQIKCPCLVLDAENEMFFKDQPQKMYDALKSPRTLFGFTSEDGADNHCQSGALAYKDEVVFNWLDDVLRPDGGAR